MVEIYNYWDVFEFNVIDFDWFMEEERLKINLKVFFKLYFCEENINGGKGKSLEFVKVFKGF